MLRLPKEYLEQAARKFPLKVSISGFGGNLSGLSGSTTPAPNGGDDIPFVQMLLDGNCPTGHSGYANSDNNGPWGDALVRELIPYVERNFRLNGVRFVTGHSSGGWSSLWLQSHYPDVFHGCWSSSPDAIDSGLPAPPCLRLIASGGGFAPILSINSRSMGLAGRDFATMKFSSGGCRAVR
ncbi:MAG TPA: alpha/beta hydrolase-fold protein [Blastocatellia bacterium]